MKRLLLFLMFISCVNFSFSQSWGIVGSATPNGWNGIDIPMTYNVDSAIWEATVELGDGEIKFRADNNWSGINYGDVEPDGVLDQVAFDFGVVFVSRIDLDQPFEGCGEHVEERFQTLLIIAGLASVT